MVKRGWKIGHRKGWVNEKGEGWWLRKGPNLKKNIFEYKYGNSMQGGGKIDFLTSIT